MRMRRSQDPEKWEEILRERFGVAGFVRVSKAYVWNLLGVEKPDRIDKRHLRAAMEKLGFRQLSMGTVPGETGIGAWGRGESQRGRPLPNECRYFMVKFKG